jgi:hypothetical protein
MEYLIKLKEFIITTNDYQIYRYSLEQLCDYVQQFQQKNEFSSFHIGSNKATTTSSSVSSLKITPKQLLIGNHGDILDIVKLPVSSSSSTSSSSSNGSIGDYHFNIALVTNSHQLRIINEQLNSCTILEGHSDIILSVDVSPDG